MAGYKNLAFPVGEIIVPSTFEMRLEWNLNQLLNYLRTWSAVNRYIDELGDDPILSLETKMKAVWKSPDEDRPVHMPIALRVSRKSG